ncbi:MAG: hypothetical protein HC915_14070 [Anaerolineae bacterium]|nr:hypothetical protein [Anaerolineae bacterium]
MSQTIEKSRQALQAVAPNFPRSTWYANAGGLGAGLVTLLVFFIVQRIFQDLPARQMIEAMHGSSNTLCFAGISASSTILPLMLTIFSFARNASVEFNPWFYKRIKSISFLCCAAFTAGLLTLMLLSAPITDLESVTHTWYQVLYLLIVGGLATMVGLLISILVLLYYAILHIITLLDPHNEAEKDR